jgi:short subunit fatty acids transporter
MHRMIIIENSSQIAVIATCSISISIAFIAVGLRLLAKKIRNRIDGSDYCIIVACVSSYLYMCVRAFFRY